MFPCSILSIAEEGEGVMGTLKAPEMAAALKKTGYAGERVVILNPVDNISIAPMSVITADMLKRSPTASRKSCCGRCRSCR